MRAVEVFDERITAAVASLPLWCKPMFLGITLLGSPAVTMTIGAVVVGFGWFKHTWRLALAGGAVLLTLGANTAIKNIVDRARPQSDYALAMPLHTQSFPSGHASGSMVAYGLLAYLAWRHLPPPWGIAAVVLAPILIALIGISRIYLGAHFPSDVLVGWILGAAMLTVIILVIRPVS